MYENDGYLGFTFNGYHSSEFGLLVVSDGDRYHQNLFSNFNDNFNSVPGQSGEYYFGTQIGSREFSIECVFDNITTHMRDKIQKWLYPNQIGWLIFDETPYKKYLVKVSQVPNFSYLPFEGNNSNRYFKQDILKGELSISFLSFKEYGIGNENFQLTEILKNKLIEQQSLDSGLLPSKISNYLKNLNIFLPNTKKNIDVQGDSQLFSIYNAGNGIATANFSFWVNNNTEWPIRIFNFEDGNNYIIEDFRSEIETTTSGRYKVEILSDKQEIWGYGHTSNYNANLSTKKNIGKYFNHFYPKIYQRKSTEVLILSQSYDSRMGPEPLFYPLSYLNDTYYPSDSKEILNYFEEFNKDLTECIMCTEKGCYEVNEPLTPSVLYSKLSENSTELFSEFFTYFIYPNKFEVNTTLLQFTPIYEHTYI